MQYICDAHSEISVACLTSASIVASWSVTAVVHISILHFPFGILNAYELNFEHVSRCVLWCCRAICVPHLQRKMLFEVASIQARNHDFLQEIQVEIGVVEEIRAT